MDRPDALGRCLDAIIRGSEIPSSIVVVDQSTRDQRTSDVVASVRRDVPPTCRISHVQSSGGMARGQNDGFALVDDDIVLVTDDDCVPDGDWVRQAHHAMQADPEIGLLGGRVLPLEASPAAPHPVASRPSPVAADLDRTSAPWSLGSGNNFAVRRRTVLAVGGNDERLGPGARFRGGADMDLFRRIMRTGVACRYEPAVVVRHARATAAERRRRRIPYGYGMGVACTLWWRQGDRHAARIAACYLAMRMRRAARGLLRREPDRTWDEALIVCGFARGLVRGSTLADAAPQQRRRAG